MENQLSQPEVFCTGQNSGRFGQISGRSLADRLLPLADMPEPTLIETRQLSALGREVPVQLFRNERGSVSARCCFGVGDTPIFDGPTTEAVLRLVEDTLEVLVLTRAWRRR